MIGRGALSPLAPPLHSGPTVKGGRAVRPLEVAMLTTLSTDELQVLQYLPTRMTFGEIGEQLLAPGDSVKWQANAVYRKLGVVTRAEAIQRAQTMGLLVCPAD